MVQHLSLQAAFWRYLLLGPLLLPSGPGDDATRFRWTKGDVLSYRLEAEVREGETISSLTGEVTLRAVSSTAAILERRVLALHQEGGGEERAATPGELAAMRVVVPVGPAGDVPEEAALSPEEREGVRGFVASIFPLPPPGGAARKEGWEIRFPDPTDPLVGRGRIGREVDLLGYRCREILIEASSGRTGRRMEGTAHFSADLGAFVQVEREIVSPGPPERRETLRLRLRRHPSGPVLDPEYRKELEIAREATSRDPENAAAWARLSRVLRSGGSMGEALRAIRKAAVLEPQVLAHRIGEGEILGLLGRLDEAKRILSGVLRARPDETRVRLHLGRILFQEGHVDAAGSQAEEARRRDPESTDARFLLGLVRAKQGRREDATRLIQSCYETVDPTNSPTVTFDGEGNLRLILPAAGSGEPPPLTEEEREAARRILEEIVREEARRNEMETEEIDRILQYIAAACHTDPPGLIAEFLRDREATARQISLALRRRSEVPLDDLRKLASSDEPELRLGAAFYLPLAEAVPVVKEIIRNDPATPAPYLHLASIILRGGGAGVLREGELLAALRTAKELDGENGIYGYLIASVLLERGETLPAIREISDSLGRPFVLTRRAAEARLRRRALTEVGFDPGFRGAVAWADSESPFAGPLGRAAEGVIALSGRVAADGKVDYAREFLKSVLSIAAQVRGTADEVQLVRETWGFERAALDALIDLDQEADDPEREQRHRKWKDSAAKEEALGRQADEAFQIEREEALHLWPITNPAGTRAYLRRALAGERKIFEGHLEAARSSGEGAGDE